MPSAEPSATEARRETSAPSDARNAYFLSLSLDDIRCFGPGQVLSLEAERGKPARWTLILGSNGVGKTTLLQLLALGAATRRLYEGQESDEPAALPRLMAYWFFAREAWIRVGQKEGKVGFEIGWADDIDGRLVRDRTTVSLKQPGVLSSRAYAGVTTSVIYGYGANRRRAPRGLTAESSSDPTKTLFDDDATLRNPEEWFLQNELVANAESPLREMARRQRDKVREILTRILPGVGDIRVAPRTDQTRQVRAEVEVNGPDGWVPFGALGLGYRTMTAWMVDLASRLFERYGDLPDPLAGAAVCLVDEIDLHLHPRWQRDLIERLTAIFPQTQFIATAHSPLVVQAAPHANIVVLRREGDHVVIDNAPQSVRNWRLDQILTSELFEVPSARPPELDGLLAERDRLLAKPELSVDDEQRLEQLRREIGELPQGDTPEDIEAMDVIRRAAKALENAR